MSKSDHQLAAVLFSDIEGYTSMIQQDEQGAIEIVQRYQKELEEIVPEFNGEVIQHYGDGSLTVFSKAGDAIKCAYFLQKKLQSSIPLRIGIHYGDVVLHDERVFGDTVNIASRIESMGQPGSVLFSREVFREIHGNSEFKSVSMGRYRFKNVNRKIEVFALANDGLTLPKVGSLQGKLEPGKWSIRSIVISGLLGSLLVALLVINLLESPSGENQLLQGNVHPSIAVLPFTNLSTDTTQEYFADGLAQEVLILLTRNPQLRVTSRSSSFSFKNQALDVATIAEKLGVDYVLEGSVQKSGDSVRISALLIDAQQDQQLWAQSWQRDLKDIFTVQQEIADSVKNALDLQIRNDRNRNPQQTDPEAYTLFLQARHLGQQGNVDGLTNAETLLRKALSIDSLYAPAWSYLSTVVNRMSNIGLRPPVEGHELARKTAYHALEIDSTQSAAWSILASISIYYDRDFQRAQYFLDQARKSEPGSINILKLSSNMAFCQGNIDEAIRLDRQSIEIDPINAKSYLDLGYGYFYNGEYTEAEQVTRHGLLMNPDYLGGPFLLSLILMEQGKLNAAKEMVLTEPYDILKIQGRALVSYAMGHEDSTEYFLNQVKMDYAAVAPYQIAQVYGYQNQVDSAFKWLELAYQYQDGGLVQVQADPFMKTLRRDPRWKTLLQKMNF